MRLNLCQKSQAADMTWLDILNMQIKFLSSLGKLNSASNVSFTNQNRLRRGEVEPKPTPVALSPEHLKQSSTGESEGYSDYDNSGSYDDTDGDTDGERLVTTKQVQVQGPRCSDDVCILLLVYWNVYNMIGSVVSLFTNLRHSQIVIQHWRECCTLYM